VCYDRSAMLERSGDEERPSRLRSLFLSLRRHTSSGLYVPELDGLRFVAISFVFIYHLAGVATNIPEGAPPPASSLYVLSQRLNIGVPLFFAISGMILGLPFARYWLQAGKKVSLKRYFLRRVTRLEPPYVVAMVMFFILKYIGHRGTIPEMLPHLGASLIYLHNLIYRQLSTINSVAWSLEVEVQFYILAPLLAIVFAIRTAWARRATIGLAILLAALWTPWAVADATMAAVDPANWIKHLSLPGNIQYFLTGFLLADFFLLMPPATYRRRHWDIVSLIGWPLLICLLIAAPDFAFLALPCLILALYAGVFYGDISNRAFASLWVASIGGMCYSIYLLHAYLIQLIKIVTERIGHTFPFEVRFAIQMMIMAPIVLAISICFYRLIEQPCMQPDWPARLRDLVMRRRRNVLLAK